jgi:hypothetical protein
LICCGTTGDERRLLIFEQRGQLIVKKQAIVQPGFGILCRIGANQRIHRSTRILSGERGPQVRGSVYEWPASTSSALDMLLSASWRRIQRTAKKIITTMKPMEIDSGAVIDSERKFRSCLSFVPRAS